MLMMQLNLISQTEISSGLSNLFFDITFCGLNAQFHNKINSYNFINKNCIIFQTKILLIIALFNYNSFMH